MARSISFPTMSVLESAAFIGTVALPTWSKGIIIRRKAVVGMAERLDLDARAVRQMQKLRAKYNGAPLLVRNPVRPQVVLFNEEDVRSVLENAPEPFSPASQEKRAALSHFEPHVSLISAGSERAERRAFNDEVLESHCPVHRLGREFSLVVEDEASELIRRAEVAGELDWDSFFESWFRVIRRIILGAAAKDDHELTDMIAKLRRRANWAFLAPKNRKLRDAFHRRLSAYLEQPDPNSLAAMIAGMPGSKKTEPTHQIAQWLFAFDPGGMATYRTLMLLVAHPHALAQARTEIHSSRDRTSLSYLRAAIVETLRLYPTTPMVLRQTTVDTDWKDGSLSKGTGILIFAPFFHRDDERWPNAHRFEPEYWLQKDPGNALPLIPFSAGPGVCPARHLVPMIGSAMLARMLQGNRQFTPLQRHRLDPRLPLPGTLNQYSIRFAISGDR